MTRPQEPAQEVVRPRWVSPAEAAVILRTSRTRVYALIAEGELVSVVEGRRRWIFLRSIDEYLDRRYRSADLGTDRG